MFSARGTIGYIAPETVCRNLGSVSHKSDVYSYGMMVLEMIGGRKNVDVGVDRTSEIYFPHWLYQQIELDEELQLIGIMNEEEIECARKMVMHMSDYKIISRQLDNGIALLVSPIVIWSLIQPQKLADMMRSFQDQIRRLQQDTHFVQMQQKPEEYS
ncbi:hypothetical protein KY289_025584 [Solanum tuberosum]|nr:hypothetical protein KY289_025584 [Solanum tuberosum]